MLGLLFLALAVWFGWQLVRALPLKLYRPEAVAAALLLGLFLGTWLNFLLSFLGYTLGAILTALVLLGAGFWLRQRSALQYQSQPRAAGFAWFSFTLITSAATLWLLIGHFLQVKPDGWYAEGYVWGDLALHMSLISFFRYQDQISFQLPVLVGAKLNYPFLVDFLSAQLLRGGLSWQAALVLPGFTLLTAFSQLFYFLAYSLFKRVGAVLVSYLVFVGGGSFAGSYYLYQDWQLQGQPAFWDWLTKAGDYTNFAAQGLSFTNPITSLLLPQRSFLFGLPIYLLLVRLLMLAEDRQSILLLAGLLVGLLPFAHFHTFLVGLLTLFWFGFWRSLELKKVARPWLAACLLAIVVASLQVVWQLQSGLHSGFSHFYLGWMRAEHQSLLEFWWKNMGGPLLLTIGGIFLLKPWQASTFFKRLLGVLLLVFLIANVVILQPNPYDNLKLIIFGYLGMSLLIGWGLAECWRRFVWATPLCVLMVIGLIATGAAALVREPGNSYLFLSNTDLAFADAVRQAIPAGALIVTADRHNHPIPTLTGRPIVMGYRGWLWTYGLDYSAQQAAVSAAYHGNTQAVQAYGAQYIVVGPPEISTWGADPNYFATYPLVTRVGDWSLYQLPRK